MKKLTAITLLAFILSVASAFTSFAFINAEKDTVTVRENALYGNVAEAEGLKVISRNHYKNRLFWETEFRPGKGEPAKTEYRYYSSEQNATVNNRNTFFQIDTDIRYGFNNSVPFEDLEGIEKIYTEMYNQCPMNGELKKTVYFSEIYEYYPLRLDMNLPGVYWSGRDYEHLYSDEKGGEAYVTNLFREFFRIPVLEGYSLEITVAKTNNGVSVGSSEAKDAQPYNFYFNTVSAITEDKVYFTIRNKTYADVYVDTSLIPGGYGIYSFDYTEGTGANDTGIDADSLAMVYALDPHGAVENMVVSENGKDLIVVETKENDTVFTVIDLETMTAKKTLTIENFTSYNVKQREFSILRASGDQYGYVHAAENLKVSREFYMLVTAEEFAVINSDYELKIRAPMMNYVDDTFNYLDICATTYYDGNKLYIADSIVNANYATQTTDYYLAVYGEAGLLYYGEYYSDLSANPNKHSYGYNCHPTADPFEIIIEE